MHTEIELLGPMAVRCGDAVHHLQSAQARAAFARLVLAGPEGVTRDELADVVWPNTLPPTWESALRTLVSRLRAFVKSLCAEPTNPLSKRGGRYVLTLGGGVRVDMETALRSVAEAHEALVAGDLGAADQLATWAAERLRFPFLSEHEGEWVATHRRRMTESLVAALEIASHAALRTGACARAALLAEEATVTAPERESAHRCLMAARAAMGNRAEALRVYQQLRRHLADELGVDPSAETESAYLALLGPSSASVGPRGHPAEVRRPVTFVGRDREMTMLADAWRRAERGRPQFVLVTGEAGVGKTRLLREAGAATVAGGGLLLVGRCDEGAITPYQPFVEALDGYVGASADDPLDAVSATSRGPLRQLLPALGGPCSPQELPEQPTLFAAVTQLVLAATGERPSAILIDDIHWADTRTLALLRHLLRATAGARLCVVVAARDDLPTSTWRQVRAELDEVMLPFEHAGNGTELALRGLDLTSAQALAHEVGRGVAASSAAHVHATCARSGGNPFMLLEMLQNRSDPEAVPPAVARLVAAKQATLGRDATRLLQVAAVTGTPVAFDPVASAAGLDVLAALDALETLLRAGILDEEDEESVADPAHPDRPATYQFRHDVVRQAVSDKVSDARRRHVTSQQRMVPGPRRAADRRLSRTVAESL